MIFCAFCVITVNSSPFIQAVLLLGGNIVPNFGEQTEKQKNIFPMKNLKNSFRTKISLFAICMLGFFAVLAFAPDAAGAVTIAGTSLAFMLPSSSRALPGDNNSPSPRPNLSKSDLNQSILDMTNMPEIDIMPVPMGLTQTIQSNGGASAVAKTAYFLNEDSYTATPTNNGSGASSISNTYGDGWGGLGYNNLAKAVNAGRGIKCYGLTIEYTQGGSEFASGLTTANLTLNFVNLVGASYIPSGVVLSVGKRNTQYLDGTMTITRTFYLNALAQISYVVPASTTADANTVATLTVNTINQ